MENLHAQNHFSFLKIDYPDLPVVGHRREFLELLKKNQVIIVKADTGSGKSTQLPKFLLEYFINELKKNVGQFKIGMTEPRRIAAISIADRLREELKDDSLVSTKIRFWEVGEKFAPIKVMTDGILLQEFRHDKLFNAYSALIIDEAHERSLNIDILLGIFKTVLTKRKDFKLVIASATLDAKLFENFYENSCILEAEGRLFPVHVEYLLDRNLNFEKDSYKNELDYSSSKNKHYNLSGKGDCLCLEEAKEAILDLESRNNENLLCFLPTERDIQDLADDLTHELDASFEILPLYGRMSPEEQHKIFRNSGKTKIVLATNIAETSLTIPGIAYVVDTGMARISRYNAQSRIQGLLVEKISKASARQRLGRAGRVKSGICVRIYSEDDFEKREEFTEPEIRRSNLASVILTLKSLGLKIEEFSFLQTPPNSAFRGAYKTLFELGAISADNPSAQITKLGLEMVRLPMDVSLSAVLLKARDLGVLKPALIVSAALSIQDPRVVPSEDPEREKVRLQHRRYLGHKSDFLTYVSMWNAIHTEWNGESYNKLRKFCDKNSFHFLRCREWIDLYKQFCRILNVSFEDFLCPLDSFHRDNLHIALLSGFLGGIAHRDVENGCYRLVSGRESFVFPGSDLYGKSAEWIFSAEIRETSRVFLNKLTEIKPEWILQVAKPFCRSRYYNPIWNRERGFVEAKEEVSFRGLVICSQHSVDYARVEPDICAEIFWREAVVLSDMARPFSFMEHNEYEIKKLRGIETRLRKYGIVPSEDMLVDYYVRIAPQVNSIKTLKKYIAEHTDQFLKFDAQYWLDMLDNKSNEFKDNFSTNAFTKLSLLIQQKPLDKTELKKENVEHFRIETLYKKSFIVSGELVYDATKIYDGITLNIPIEVISHITPAILALSIHQWRTWLIESIISEMPRVSKKNIDDKKILIDDIFCEKLKKMPYKSPLFLLYEVFLQIKDGNYLVPTVVPEKEHHLRLHIKVFDTKKSTNDFSFELNPEWGVIHFFSAVRDIVEKNKMNVILDEFSYGWRLGNFYFMDICESEFWQKFYKRIHKFWDDENKKIKENKSIEKKYSLIMDRLNRLEIGGVFSDGFITAPKNYVACSLISDDFDANLCEVFSGLEFTHKKVIKDFKNLAPALKSEDETLQLSLIRATYESALLGGKPFIYFWSLLKKFSFAVRKKTEKTKIEENVYNIIKNVYNKQNEDFLFKRLILISEYLLLFGILDSSCSRNFIHRSSETVFNEDLYVPVKNLREQFRPFFKSRLLKGEELKNAQSQLLQVERSPMNSLQKIENYLEARKLLENFEILKFKRQKNDIEESIEQSDIDKLKEYFNQK